MKEAILSSSVIVIRPESCTQVPVPRRVPM